MYKPSIKAQAFQMRKEGKSLGEIVSALGIAKSTASLWSSQVELSSTALAVLANKKINARKKATLTLKRHRKYLIETYNRSAEKTLSKIQLNKELKKLLCSVFFWTEGGKHTDSYVYFINSDPKMIQVFLNVLRASFSIDEDKLRAMVHVHEYHDEKKIKSFWSEITNIPLNQFSKSYLKSHTKKRIREGYKGSIRIRYYDHKVALELRSLYNKLCEVI